MTHGADTVHLNEHAGEHGHPDERTYIKIAILLSVITLVEVVIYYLGLPHGLLVALLMAFSAVKFYTVVSMFMHLRFDDRRLTYIFLGGLFLGGSILIVLDVLLHHHSIVYAMREFSGQPTDAPAT